MYVVVVVHLGVVDLGQAVLDGEGMEVERVLEDRRFLDRRVLEVDPVQRAFRDRRAGSRA